MSIYIPDIWIWIIVAFGITLFTTLVMNAQGKYFFSKDVVLRKFSIIDLQFAATGQEIVNIIKGIYLLPEEKSKKAVNALRSQLYVDFLFMPAVYGGIFLLCMKVSNKMLSVAGEDFFAILAWLQIIPWLCDLYENSYLLNKLNNPKAATPQTHKFFQRIVVLKWGISLLGAVCSIAALFYFWLVGYYSVDSLPYILIIFAELILFIIARKMISNKLKKIIKE